MIMLTDQPEDGSNPSIGLPISRGSPADPQLPWMPQVPRSAPAVKKYLNF
jgi:hypothetical protein